MSAICHLLSRTEKRGEFFDFFSFAGINGGFNFVLLVFRETLRELVPVTKKFFLGGGTEAMKAPKLLVGRSASLLGVSAAGRFIKSFSPSLKSEGEFRDSSQISSGI